MIANGVTTAYHGITYSWEPGLRGRDTAVGLVRALAEAKSRLPRVIRFHLRFEVFNLEAVDEAEEWIESGTVDLLAFNDHLADIQAKARKGGLRKYADRSGLPLDGFKELLARTKARADGVPAAIERLAKAALKAGIPILSHDDPSPWTRDFYHDAGSRVSEFPMTLETARHARDRGDAIVLGGPNVLRGGSHAGRLGAEDAIRAGACYILTSDYCYPSMLQAVFNLAERGVLDLGHTWNLVSSNAARTARLEDRGAL